MILKSLWEKTPKQTKLTLFCLAAAVPLVLVASMFLGSDKAPKAEANPDDIATQAFRMGGEAGFSDGYQAGIASFLNGTFEQMKLAQQASLTHSIDTDSNLLAQAVVTRSTQYRLSAARMESETGKPASEWLHDQLRANLAERTVLVRNGRPSMAGGQDTPVVQALVNGLAIKLAIAQVLGGNAVDGQLPLETGLSPTQAYLVEYQGVEGQIKQQLEQLRQFTAAQPPAEEVRSEPE